MNATAEVFVRTPAARMAALDLANEVRFARSRMKKALRAGSITAPGLLTTQPSWLRSMKVARFLMAIPGVGAVKARRLMLLVPIADGKTVGGLSDRQRAALVALLRLAEPTDG